MPEQLRQPIGSTSATRPVLQLRRAHATNDGVWTDCMAGGGGTDVEYPYDLGSYARTVTTTSADAQRWFDRGLNWCFGFHHEEAVACFEKALEADPNCAM